jgi:PAS domain S-box-containing protein
MHRGRDTIKNRIIVGFSTVMLILFTIVIVNYVGLQNNEKLVNRVTELRSPTAQASSNVLNGINQSLAGLRGYILLNDEDFINVRIKAWDVYIDPNFSKLEKLSTNWTNPKNVERLTEIKPLLEKFRQAQVEIENIANTDENIPAFNMLLTQAAPQAAIMASKITEIIDEELKRGASAKSKALLGMMADVRGTLGLGLANIRAYLLTGDTKFRDKFKILWVKNERRYKDLSRHYNGFNAKQKSAFNVFKSARENFVNYPDQMFSLRSAEDWNIANYWLKTKAAPKASRITELLEEMVVNQQELLLIDINELQELSGSMKITTLISAATAIIFVFFVITTIVQEITEIKKIQNALIESEERYRTIFENSEELIFTVDKKGILIDLNHGPKGSQIEEFIGKNIIDLLHYKKENQTVINAVNRVFNTKNSVNFETSNLYENKQSYYSTTLSPIVIDGKVNKAIAIARDITTHKEAEQEIEKLASIIQSSKDFIGITDLDGKVEQLNSAAKKLVGITSDKFLKSIPILDYFRTSEKKRIKEEIMPFVLKKGHWSGETEFQHFKTKMLIPVYFDIFRIDDPKTKEPTHFGTITRDLSENEKIRIRIAKSEKGLNEAQKIGKVGSWELDLVNKKLHWSDEIYNLLGLEVNSIVPTNEIYLSFIHTDDLNMVNKAFYNHIHNQVEYNITYRIKTTTGDIKYVQQRCETEWDENYIAVRSLGTISDITEQKLIEIELEKYKTHLEELVEERTKELEFANLELELSSSELKKTYMQLTQNEAKYRFLAENSYDVVLAYNADLKRTYVSPSIKRLTGFTVSETFKMSLTDCLYPSDAIYLADLYQSASKKREKDRIIRTRRLTKKKGYIWIESAISFVYGKKNNLDRIIISMRDISNQIQAENELKETQDKLVESNKMASLGLLTAGVAHEINNPVNFVSAGINSLEDNLIDIGKILETYQLITPNNVVASLKEINNLKSELKYNKLLHYIKQATINIKNGVARTSEIIKGLQSFSRGKSEEMKVFVVRECIDNALLLLRDLYKDRIKIVKNYCNTVQLTGHPEKLNQVFLNILINSIQAIKEEGTITAELSRTKKSGIEYLEVSITDTGEGMSNEVKSKIFEPFYTSKVVGKGTGLGLSISHGIINDHNGFIEVESKVGIGTKFCIYLPI